MLALVLFSFSVFAGTNFDHIRLNGTTISTTSTNADLTLSPNGTGDVRTSKQVGIGGAPDASALFQVTSTTQGGICAPVMTSTQRGNISSPTEGLTVYNSSQHLLSWYDGSGWNDIPSTLTAGAGGSGGINLLSTLNWDAEKGATTNWTNTGSGTASTTTTAANVGFGTYAFSWDAAAASDTFCSTAVTVPSGLYGANCGADYYYKGFDTNVSALVSDGSNTLVSHTLSAQSGFTHDTLGFTCPSSGSIKFCLSASANAAIGYLDNVTLGTSPAISNVSQAIFVGSAHFATTTSCDWSKSSATLVAFTTTSACPGPTVDSNPGPGTIQTTDVDLPRVTLNNLPPGRYRVVFAGIGGSSGAGSAFYAINDGTTTGGRGAANSVSGATSGFFVENEFEYTTTANRSFELFNANSASTTVVYNSSGIYQTNFYIYRYPSSTETAFRPEQSPASWSGYHDSTCSWGRTSTSFGDPTADATCAFTELTNRNFGTVTSHSSGGNKEPGIVFTPSRAGMYLVCASFTLKASANSAAVQLTDGTTVFSQGHADVPGAAIPFSQSLCGIANATSTSSVTIKLQTANRTSGTATIEGNTGSPTENAVNWQIVALDQGVTAPLLINSVATGYAGVTKIGSVAVNSGCTTTSTNTQGLYASGVSNSTGNCTTTFTTGYFSATPVCTCTVIGTSGSNNLTCAIDNTTSPTATVLRTYTWATSTNTATATGFTLTCVGPN